MCMVMAVPASTMVVSRPVFNADIVMMNEGCGRSIPVRIADGRRCGPGQLVVLCLPQQYHAVVAFNGGVRRLAAGSGRQQ